MRCIDNRVLLLAFMLVSAMSVQAAGCRLQANRR